MGTETKETNAVLNAIICFFLIAFASKFLADVSPRVSRTLKGWSEHRAKVRRAHAAYRRNHPWEFYDEDAEPHHYPY